MTSEEIQKEGDLRKLHARLKAADIRKKERRLILRRCKRIFGQPPIEPSWPDSDDMDDFREEKAEWERQAI